jgi:glycosyltransferase 2 family protein
MTYNPEAMTRTNPKPAESVRRGLVTGIKIAVTALGLFLVLNNLDHTALAEVLASVDGWWMAAGACLMLVSLVVRAYRWQIILRGIGSSIPFNRLVELYFVGSFFNAFLPSGIGGDVVRAAEAAQDVETQEAVSSVLVDRLTGLMALLAMAVLMLPFRPSIFPDELAWLVAIVCVLGLTVGFIILDGRMLRNLISKFPKIFRKPGQGFIERLIITIESCGWSAINQALLISVVFNLIQVGWWATTGKAIGLTIPYSYYMLVVPIMAAALLIPSVGGLGVREWLAPTLFAGTGIGVEAAVALTILVFALERLASLLGAPVYIFASIRDYRLKKRSGETISPR